MNKNKLLALLFAWVLLVVAGGIGFMMHLGGKISGKGPLALAADGHGGFFLSADSDLLHFDADEKVVARHSLEKLGLKSANGLHYRDGELLAYDNERHRIFRCNTGNWTCGAFSPSTLSFSDFVSMAWLPSGELLVSDNNNHRLVTLNADGRPAFISQSVWHFPNQVTAQEDGLLLADTDRFSILHLANAGATTTQTRLQTGRRPYQFLQRDTSWWVLHAGIKLEGGELYRYRDGEPEKISIAAEDPVALLDSGKRLIVASRQDWRLLSIDPESGNAVPVSDTAFQTELTAKRLRTQAIKKQRGRIPYFMLLALLPALIGGVVLQRKQDQKESEEQAANSRTDVVSRTQTASTSVRIDTDRSALEMQRMQQNRTLLRLALIAIPVVLLFAVGFWLIHDGDAKAGKGITLFLSIFFIVPLFLALILYLGRRQQDRLFDQHFICGPNKLVHVKQGKPVGATAYENIWLGDATLLLNDRRQPLYMGQGRHRTALWTAHDVQREIGSRIPSSQHFATDFELGKALLRSRPGLGARLMLAKFAVIGLILLALIAKLISVLDHFHLLTLWKIFKPD